MQERETLSSWIDNRKNELRPHVEWEIIRPFVLGGAVILWEWVKSQNHWIYALVAIYILSSLYSLWRKSHAWDKLENLLKEDTTARSTERSQLREQITALEKQQNRAMQLIAEMQAGNTSITQTAVPLSPRELEVKAQVGHLSTGARTLLTFALSRTSFTAVNLFSFADREGLVLTKAFKELQMAGFVSGTLDNLSVDPLLRPILEKLLL